MDRRGREQDNIFVERLWWSVKHERYSSKKSLHHSIFTLLIKGYYVLFNYGRQYQSLGYGTPDKVYRAISGVGARIVDKYSKNLTSRQKS